MLPRRQRDRLVQSALRDRFVVTLEGDTFEGLLVEADERTLILVDAFEIRPSGTRIGVDGALYLERHRVLYLQRPAGLPAPEPRSQSAAPGAP